MLLALFGVLECVTRLWLIPASADLQRFGGYPARARALVSAPGARVALIGNSTTEAGVDAESFGAALGAKLGRPVSAAMFVADGATAGVMRSMVETEFWRAGINPDLMVVGFFEDILDDHSPFDVGRSAMFFIEPRDWPEVFELELPRLEQRADLVLSSLWATFATRDRIEERLLLLIPGYKQWITNVNAVNFDHERARAAIHSSASAGIGQTTAPPTDGHAVLSRFVARAREQGVRLCFVAFPIRRKTNLAEPWIYELSTDVPRIISDAGMLFIDLRRVNSLGPQHYRDHLHLNEQGRALFMSRLVDELAPSLSPLAPPVPAPVRTP